MHKKWNMETEYWLYVTVHEIVEEVTWRWSKCKKAWGGRRGRKVKCWIKISEWACDKIMKRRRNSVCIRNSELAELELESEYEMKGIAESNL